MFFLVFHLMSVTDARGQRWWEQVSTVNGPPFSPNTCQKVFLIISLCKYSMSPCLFNLKRGGKIKHEGIKERRERRKVCACVWVLCRIQKEWAYQDTKDQQIAVNHSLDTSHTHSRTHTDLQTHAHTHTYESHAKLLAQEEASSLVNRRWTQPQAGAQPDISTSIFKP